METSISSMTEVLLEAVGLILCKQCSQPVGCSTCLITGFRHFSYPSPLGTGLAACTPVSYQIRLITVHSCDSKLPSQAGCVSRMYSNHQDLISTLYKEAFPGHVLSEHGLEHSFLYCSGTGLPARSALSRSALVPRPGW